MTDTLTARLGRLLAATHKSRNAARDLAAMTHYLGDVAHGSALAALDAARTAVGYATDAHHGERLPSLTAADRHARSAIGHLTVALDAVVADHADHRDYIATVRQASRALTAAAAVVDRAAEAMTAHRRDR